MKFCEICQVVWEIGTATEGSENQRSNPERRREKEASLGIQKPRAEGERRKGRGKEVGVARDTHTQTHASGDLIGRERTEDG